MNFVADESVDRQIVEQLRKDNHEIFSIAEESPSISDTEVLTKANSSDAVLITADKDFGELVFRLNQNHDGVILLRLAGVPPERKADIVSAFLRVHSDEIIGAFTVISMNNVRIRARELKNEDAKTPE
jgi:predicted nuclease of predicted toxin-antitoxin system